MSAEVSGERGRLIAVETPSPARIAPFCPLFGTCGGCATQHFAPELYAAWKTGLVETALTHAGLQADVTPLRPAHGAGRRRVTFHARAGRDGEEPVVGFMAARSHEIVPSPPVRCSCPRSPVRRRWPGSRAGARPGRASRSTSRSRRPRRVSTSTCAGTARPAPAAAAPSRRSPWSSISRACPCMATSSWSCRPPLVTMGGAQVIAAAGRLPAGHRGRRGGAGRARAGRIRQGAPGRRSLRRRRPLRAAHRRARQRARRRKRRVRPRRARPRRTAHARAPADQIEERDLYPPAAGSAGACRLRRRGARSPAGGRRGAGPGAGGSVVPLVVYVSCNAATLCARRAHLVDGGLSLVRVTPVDQFQHSAHVELVGVFRRPPPRARDRSGHAACSAEPGTQRGARDMP